jgi:hypothetical protein
MGYGALFFLLIKIVPKVPGCWNSFEARTDPLGRHLSLTEVALNKLLFYFFGEFIILEFFPSFTK